MRTKPMTFGTWSEAYSACREMDRPIRVCVLESPDEDGTVYPSGHFRADKKEPNAKCLMPECRKLKE